MGIKDRIVRVADKAGNAVAKVSSLSSDQLKMVAEKQEEYLSQMPSAMDPAAEEYTARLLASCGVEIHGAYLPQIDQLYVPIEPTVEYDGRPFDAQHNMRFLGIKKWVVDPAENSLEKLVNVYDVLSDENCNIALVFNRTKKCTNVFIAVSDVGNSDNNVDADCFAKRLQEAIRGNFSGSEVSSAGFGALPALEEGAPYSVAAISNIPAEKSEKFISQTIEKVLDGIVPRRRSEEYTLILLATPVQDAEQRKLRLSELFTALAPFAAWSTNFTYTQSDAAMAMATIGVNAGVSAGRQNGVNSAISTTDGVTDSTSHAVTDSVAKSITDTTSASKTMTESTFESATAGGSFSTGVKPFGVGGEASASVSTTGGSSESVAVATSTARAVGETTGKAVANSLGRAVSNSVGKTVGAVASTSLGANFGASFARASSVTATIGKNEGITQSFTNHAVKHSLQILEDQMKRLDEATALGLWDFAAYVVSEEPDIANNVAHSYLATTQGEESYLSQSSINLWRGDMGEESGQARTICEYLRTLRHPLFSMAPGLLDVDSRFAVYPAVVSATTSLSGKELAYSLNFPRKSVAGLPVIECAEFGRNVTSFDERALDSGFQIGNIFHMHQEEPVPVALNPDSLTAHAFITGSTGAGKTNTVCKILDEAIGSGLGFLVIEPAKGEYKDIFGGLDDVSVYGTNPDLTPLLQINPFSFPEGIHVLEHLDRLVEIFNVCWPMYAAMPAVLKNAIEKSYEDCGWDLTESSNCYGNDLFPVFADVARNVKVILDTSEYDAENKGAYKGSLLTRLQSLTNGLNGMILSSSEIAAEDLFDKKVVVDLSRVGSTETKSLLMGLLVLKLQEHRMVACEGMNAPLRHITVLEEAHNLLKSTASSSSSESGNLLGKSVEMLSNAIAEMRTYGEGFIIADQAPGLLDMSAIRNTNTKIIMRLPDLSDRELVGRAANLSDGQIVELARLPRGVAAVYQNDWIEPVLCKVAKAEEGSTYSYRRERHAGTPVEAGVSFRVADILANAGSLPSCVSLSEIKAYLEALGLVPSMRVAVLKAIENPPVEPRMTKIAPLMTALFPNVHKKVVESVNSSSEMTSWTRAAEDATESLAASELSDRTRRMIVQGIITDYVFNELGDERSFKDWYNWGGLR